MSYSDTFRCHITEDLTWALQINNLPKGEQIINHLRHLRLFGIVTPLSKDLLHLHYLEPNISPEAHYPTCRMLTPDSTEPRKVFKHLSSSQLLQAVISHMDTVIRPSTERPGAIRILNVDAATILLSSVHSHCNICTFYTCFSVV